MIIGEYSDLAQGQVFRSNGGLGCNAPSWGMGGGVNGAANADYYSVAVVGYPPNSQVYFKDPAWEACTECQDPSPNTWIQPALKSGHPGGIHALMADGSASFLNQNINIVTLRDLADRDDAHPSAQF